MEKSIHNKFKFNILCMVCAGIVPLLVTGPFLPDLLVSILSLWFIYYCVRHKMYSVYKNTYFYFFIAFCIVCIISSLLSDNILLSLESSLFYFRIGIFALLISFLIDHNKKILDSYRESPWGNTQRAQKEGLEFNKEQYQIINQYCKNKNIEWFASAWDINSLNFLDPYNLLNPTKEQGIH